MVNVMKMLAVFPYALNVRDVLVALCAMPLLSTSVALNAEDRTITKSSTPSIINVVSSGGTGLAFFSLLGSDFPAGTTVVTPLKLRGVEWRTTSYPQVSGETVELCYFRPFKSRDSNCRTIWPNSTGVLHDFDDLQFGQGASVTIKHHVESGGVRIASPAGNDSVSFYYSH
jgi:hypothetical protein